MQGSSLKARSLKGSFQEALQRAFEGQLESPSQPVGNQDSKNNPLKTHTQSATLGQSSVSPTGFTPKIPDLMQLAKERSKQSLVLKTHHLATYAKTPPSKKDFIYILAQSERILKLEPSELWRNLEWESSQESAAHHLSNETLLDEQISWLSFAHFNEHIAARARSLLS